MASLLLPGFRHAAVFKAASPTIANPTTTRLFGSLAHYLTTPSRQSHLLHQPTVNLSRSAILGIRTFYNTPPAPADKPSKEPVELAKEEYKKAKRELKESPPLPKDLYSEKKAKVKDLKQDYKELKRDYKDLKEQWKQEKKSSTVDIAAATGTDSSDKSSRTEEIKESSSAEEEADSSSPLGALARKVKPSLDSTSSPPGLSPDDTATNGHTVSKGFALFLLGSAASVFGIVVFGGLTRLTESGLSITQWKPVTGAWPPLSESDWESEFALYRSTPEYAKLNPHMDLAEFKKIYFMEWFHRVWGRFIGVSYFAGLLYYAARKGPSSQRYLSRKMFYGATAALAGIGAQGFVGWWMVASGLTDDLFAQGAHPRVSHYRLTAHLAMAFGLYTAMFLMGTRVLRNRWFLTNPVEGLKIIDALQHPHLALFRRFAIGVTCLVFLTAMSGALVAGLDAGLIYNEFPYMGNGLAPPKKELFDKFYCRKEDGSDLWWRNLFENPSTVQLDHRILAMSTLTAVLALWAYSRMPRVASVMPAHVKKGVTGLVHLTLFQVVLGISTLIYMVPIPLGALHQAGSLMVLTGALGLAHRLHIPKSLIPHLRNRLSVSGHAATKNSTPPRV